MSGTLSAPPTVTERAASEPSVGGVNAVHEPVLELAAPPASVIVTRGEYAALVPLVTAVSCTVPARWTVPLAADTVREVAVLLPVVEALVLNPMPGTLPVRLIVQLG